MSYESTKAIKRYYRQNQQQAILVWHAGQRTHACSCYLFNEQDIPA